MSRNGQAAIISIVVCVVTTAIVLGYLFGAKHGYESGYYAGYDYGWTSGLAMLPNAEYNAMARGYEAGWKASAEENFYRGVYSTCMSVNYELYHMPLNKRIVACQRGVAWAYSENWLWTFSSEGFIWPIPNQEVTNASQ